MMLQIVRRRGAQTIICAGRRVGGLQVDGGERKKNCSKDETKGVEE